MHPDLEVGKFRDLDPNARVGTVADIASFAEGAAILDGNDEILRQQRRQNIDLSLLIGFRPSLFKFANVRGGF